jgi:hypothetical protein
VNSQAPLSVAAGLCAINGDTGSWVTCAETEAGAFHEDSGNRGVTATKLVQWRPTWRWTRQRMFMAIADFVLHRREDGARLSGDPGREVSGAGKAEHCR